MLVGVLVVGTNNGKKELASLAQFIHNTRTMKNKRPTNIQLVKQVMETGSPLNQVFVLECMDKWSSYILDNQDKVRKQMENHMIHPDAWIGCAQHVRDSLNKHL